jgi:hypothetical protein
MVAVFFLKGKYYYAFIFFLKTHTHILKMGFHLETLNFKIIIDLIDVYQYRTP